MSKIIRYLLLCLLVILLLSFPVQAGDLIRLRRIRVISNPVPEEIEGREVLEITFKLIPPGWIPEVGWVLCFYNVEKERLGTLNTAYFRSLDTPSHHLAGPNFKGGNTYIALFPLWPETAYTVLVIGNSEEQEVVLVPYTALLQEFDVLEQEVQKEILRSDYTFISTRRKGDG